MSECRLLPDAAVSCSGWPVDVQLKYPHWTENYLVYGNELTAPHPVSVIRGNLGYLVHSQFFTTNNNNNNNRKQSQSQSASASVSGVSDDAILQERLWNYARVPKGAFYMDDVWISGQLAAVGVPRVVVPLDRNYVSE